MTREISVLALSLLLLTTGCVSLSSLPSPLTDTDSSPPSQSAMSNSDDRAAGPLPAPQEDAPPQSTDQPANRGSATPDGDRHDSNASQSPHGPVVTIDPDAGYANLTVSPQLTITNISVTNPQNQTQEPNITNQSSPFVLGFLEPATRYNITIHAQKAENGTNVTFHRSFVTDPPTRTWHPLTNQSSIHPGVELAEGGTLNVLLRDATNETLYFVTAGHVAENRRQLYVQTPELQSHLLGPVVLWKTNPSFDYAIARVTDSARPLVNPTITHWTGPAGVASYGHVEDGDTVCVYGNGDGYEDPNRKARCGTLDFYDEGKGDRYPAFGWWGDANAGDSGGPVVHYETGRIIGLMKSGTTPGPHMPSYLFGDPICSVLMDLQQEGFHLSLIQTPYNPPPAELAPYPGELDMPGANTPPYTSPCDATPWQPSGT